MIDKPKNIQFTRLIRAGGRLREFNFRKSQGLNNAMYTIDVVSENNDRYFVFFRLINGTWVLENKKIISWIEGVLPEIQEAIRNYKE